MFFSVSQTFSGKVGLIITLDSTQGTVFNDYKNQRKMFFTKLCLMSKSFVADQNKNVI